MPRDIEELEDIFDSAVSSNNTNLRGLGRSVLSSLRDKYGDQLEDFLYDGRGASQHARPQRQAPRETGPVQCDDDEELARIIWENKKEDPDCYKGTRGEQESEQDKEERDVKGTGGPDGRRPKPRHNLPPEPPRHDAMPIEIDGFEKSGKRGMSKKQLTAFMLKIISNLDGMEDNVFTMFYLQLSKDFERRFNVEGLCDTLNSTLGVQECLDGVALEMQKVVESA